MPVTSGSLPAMRAFVFVLLLLLTACSAKPRLSIQARVQGVARADGSPIDVLVLRGAGRGPHPVLLYLDGSSCRSVTSTLHYLKPFQDLGLHAVAPEKRGVRPDGQPPCSAAFHASGRLERLDDVRRVLDALPALVPDWDGRLVILGGSEGAALAPAVAAGRTDVLGLVLLAGGGLAQGRELEILAERNRQQSQEDLRKVYTRIEADPRADRLWRGLSHYRWASWLRWRPADEVARVQAPVLLAHGTRDAQVPIESADALAQAIQAVGGDLTYVRMDGVDHTWHDASGRQRLRELGGRILAWLRPKLAVQSADKHIH